MHMTVWGAAPIVLTSWQKILKGFALVWRTVWGSQSTIFFTCVRCRAIEENKQWKR